MNREAVALGTPVWTTFEGRLGAVDERLIAEGRLRRLHDAGEIELRKREHAERRRACAAIPGCWSICCASLRMRDIRAQPRAPIRRSSRGECGCSRRFPVPLSTPPT